MAAMKQLLTFNLIFLFVFGSIGASGDLTDFAEWLSKLRFPLPNVALPVTKEFHVETDHVVCDGLSLGQVTPWTRGYVFGLRVEDVAFNCQGQVMLVGEESHRGDLFFSIVNGSFMHFDINISVDEELGLPIKATASDVRTRIALDLDIQNLPPIEEDLMKLILPVLDKGLSEVIDAGAWVAINELVDSALSELLVHVADDLNPLLTTTMPPILPTRQPGDIDLLKDKFIYVFSGVISDVLGSKAGSVSFNNIIHDITDGTNEITFNLEEAPIPLSIGTFANATIFLKTAHVSGLNHIQLFDVAPVDSLDLASRLVLVNISMTLQFDLEVALNRSNGYTEPIFYHDGSVALSVESDEGQAIVHVVVDDRCLQQLASIQYYEKGCVESCVSGLGLHSLLTSMRLSPLVLDITGDSDLDKTVEDLLHFFNTSYSMVFDPVVNNILSSHILPVINEGIANYLNTQPNCSPRILQTWWPTYVATACGLFLFFMISIYIHHISIKDKSSSSDFSDLQPLLAKQQTPHAVCLAAEPHLSTIVRYGLPFVTIVTTVLLVMSHTRNAGETYPEITFNGTSVPMETLSVLKFTSTVKQMWDAKIYYLAALIATLSGVWPYLKLLLLLFCWLVPLNRLSVSKRETLIQILDVAGKWSLLDIYVSIMLIVGLHFSLPLDAPSVEGTTSVALWVRPVDGLFAYWAVIMVSLLLSHLMLYAHRSCVYHNLGLSPIIQKPEALCNHTFVMNASFIEFTSFGKCFIGILIVGTFSAIIYGSRVLAFTFHIQGFIAWLLETDDQTIHRHFSLWSMFVSLPSSSPDENDPSIRFIQVLFILFAFFVPLLQQLLLAMLWYLPLRPKWQRRLYHCTEILFAWAALEVFLLSVIVAVLQLRLLANFIIGTKCDALNALLRIFLATVLDGNDRCFDVKTEVNHGTTILCVCVVVNFFETIFVMRLCHEAVNVRNGNSSGLFDQRTNRIIAKSTFAGKPLTKLGCSLGLLRKESTLNGGLEINAE